IDFGNDVAQNVGQREEEEPAVSNEWSEADAFRSANIRKNHDRTHHGEDRGEVGRTGRSEYRTLGSDQVVVGVGVAHEFFLVKVVRQNVAKGAQPSPSFKRGEGAMPTRCPAV